METSDAQNTVIGGTQKIIGDQFKYIIVRKGMTAEQSQMFKRLQRQKETVKKLQTESLEAANSFRWGNDKFKTKNEHLLFLNQEWVAMINTNIDKYHLNKYLKKLSPFKV